MQDFCKVNGYWRYMFGQIYKLFLLLKDATLVIQKAFDTKLIK